MEAIVKIIHSKRTQNRRHPAKNAKEGVGYYIKQFLYHVEKIFMSATFKYTRIIDLEEA